MQRQNGRSGVLKDHAEDDIVRTLGRPHQNARRADAEIGGAGRDRRSGIDIGATFAKIDLKPARASLALSRQ
jgi:hypothetical protein